MISGKRLVSPMSCAALSTNPRTSWFLLYSLTEATLITYSGTIFRAGRLNSSTSFPLHMWRSVNCSHLVPTSSRKSGLYVR